jgi:hypothetical protein
VKRGGRRLQLDKEAKKAANKWPIENPMNSSTKSAVCAKIKSNSQDGDREHRVTRNGGRSPSIYLSSVYCHPLFNTAQDEFTILENGEWATRLKEDGNDYTLLLRCVSTLGHPSLVQDPRNLSNP